MELRSLFEYFLEPEIKCCHCQTETAGCESQNNPHTLRFTVPSRSLPAGKLNVSLVITIEGHCREWWRNLTKAKQERERERRLLGYSWSFAFSRGFFPSFIARNQCAREIGATTPSHMVKRPQKRGWLNEEWPNSGSTSTRRPCEERCLDVRVFCCIHTRFF